MENKNIEQIIRESVKGSLEKAGVLPKKPLTENVSQKKPIIQMVKDKLHENFVLTPKSFLLKTEFLSSRAKEAHEKLYNAYVKAFDKVSSEMSAAPTEESDSNSSVFRDKKINEQYNLNAIKLHELYFSNISSINSTISVDSIPYMKLSRDFGSFEKWQYDFRACCMASREGWAVTYYEPLRNVYMNCVIDNHTQGVPMGCIPIIVIDMWAHSYYRDYLDDKKSYVNAMMKELNWSVVEARMIVAERSRLSDIYEIKPIVNELPHKMLSAIEQGQAPIGSDQIETDKVQEPQQKGGF